MFVHRFDEVESLLFEERWRISFNCVISLDDYEYASEHLAQRKSEVSFPAFIGRENEDVNFLSFWIKSSVLSN